MESFLHQIMATAGAYLPKVAAAIGILVVGWIIAMIAASAIRAALNRTTLDNRLAAWFAGDEKARKINIEAAVGRVAYYLVMLFVLVAFFQALELTMVTEPLNALLTRLFEFVPRILGGGALLLVAWLLATALRYLLRRGLAALKLDERFASEVGRPAAEGKPGSVVNTIAEAVYWFVFLLFLPGILDALALTGMMAPVQGMVDQIIGFLPNLFTAAITLAIGWFLARIVQRIVANLLAAVGVDAFSQKVGLAPALGGQRLSSVLGLVVYVLILVPVLIAAMTALQLDAITQPLSNVLNTILNAVPAIFAAVLVLTISYMVGRVVSQAVANLLAGAGFNGLMARLGLGREAPADDRRSPAAIAGTLILVTIMLFAATEAARLLGFSALAALVAEFLVFAGHIILGLAIFGLGLFLANLAAGTIRQSASRQAGLLAMVARVAILVLAGAMALRQMGLANDIISLAFGLTLGAVAIAAAIAFGIGGRDIAARKLETWVRSMDGESAPGSSG